MQEKIEKMHGIVKIFSFLDMWNRDVPVVVNVKTAEHRQVAFNSPAQSSQWFYYQQRYGVPEIMEILLTVSLLERSSYSVAWSFLYTMFILNSN